MKLKKIIGVTLLVVLILPAVLGTIADLYIVWLDLRWQLFEGPAAVALFMSLFLLAIKLMDDK